MSQPPTFDDDDEEYFYDLVVAAPDEDEVLKTMEDGLWFQVLLASKTTRLSAEEKALLINKRHVDWAKLLTDFLMAVAVNRATTQGNAPIRSKKLTAAKLSLLDVFQAAFDPESVRGDSVKKICWRSALRSLAIDFMRLVEEGSLRDHKPLPEAIVEILASD